LVKQKRKEKLTNEQNDIYLRRSFPLIYLSKKISIIALIPPKNVELNCGQLDNLSTSSKFLHKLGAERVARNFIFEFRYIDTFFNTIYFHKNKKSKYLNKLE